MRSTALSAQSEARRRVLAAARSFLGTPFHDHGRVKHVGVDCAQLLCLVYAEAGIIPEFDPGYYPVQQFLHDHAEREIMIGFVSRFAREIPEAEVKPGDVVLYQIARAYAHAAIVVDWPGEVIHAHKLSNRVIAMPAFAYDMEGRKTRFFSFWTT